MRFSAILSLSLSLPFALAEQLQIPFVQSAIAKQNAKFNKYTSYDGPTGTALSALSATQAAVARPKVNAIAAPKVAAVTTPYWYEAITHQGKAAFNSNTGYTVFRNVQTYGAKG